MKKISLTIFGIAIFALVFHFGGKVEQKANKFLDMASNSETVSQIKRQVLTGGALRGPETAAKSSLTVSGIIRWTNSQRQSNGSLPALKENAQLDQAAAAKVKDMFDRQYFEHNSPDGKGPADLAAAAHYEYVDIGENLAMGNFKDDQALVQAWMDSPGHRANILNNKFQEIGVAVGRGMFQGKMTWLAVQEFGKPLASCPEIDPTLKDKISSLQREIDQLEPQLKFLKAQLDSQDPQTREEYDAYNKQVSDYNNLVKIYNNKADQLKSAVEIYNGQVKAFNACAG
ncbi:MAG: CAP domain-containing protein [Patescibacteria group bacterium]|nr:CAP domain-containing protein [Patescibacteria group bacterium]